MNIITSRTLFLFLRFLKYNQFHKNFQLHPIQLKVHQRRKKLTCLTEDYLALRPMVMISCLKLNNLLEINDGTVIIISKCYVHLILGIILFFKIKTNTVYFRVEFYPRISLKQNTIDAMCSKFRKKYCVFRVTYLLYKSEITQNSSFFDPCM